MKPITAPSVRRASPWLSAVLALALVYLQTVGLLHRVAHAPQALARVSQTAPHDGATTAQATAGERVWDALFHHPAQGEDCRLFDQLSLAELALDAPALAAPPPAGTVAAWPAAAPRGAAARLAHRARAPPAA
jgi:hypothetical protein